MPCLALRLVRKSNRDAGYQLWFGTPINSLSCESGTDAVAGPFWTVKPHKRRCLSEERIPIAMSEPLEDFHKAVTRKTVTVEPGAGRAVGLGVYASSEPEPDFDLVFSPDMEDEIGISPERLNIHGEAKYMVLYMFHNYGDVPCTITIRRTPKDY